MEKFQEMPINKKQNQLKVGFFITPSPYMSPQDDIQAFYNIPGRRLQR